MPKRAWWLVLALGIIALCTFSYVMFFVWKLSPYFGVIMTVIIVSLFIIGKQKDKIKANYKQICTEFAIVLGLCAIYTNLYLYGTLFHVEFPYLVAMSAAISIIVGILIFNIARSIIYICISASLGVVMSVILTLSPILWVGDLPGFNYALFPTIHSTVLLFITTFFVSFFGAIIGDFLSELIR
jgi:hypothetical protein